MSEADRRGGGMLGAKWGLALSAVLAVPLVTCAFVLSALEDCAPGVACHAGPSRRMLAGAVLVAIGIGFGTQLLVNVTFRRLAALARDRRGEE
jgi:hypothetical protein